MLPKSNRIILPSDFYKLKKFGKRISNLYFSISFISDSKLDTPLFSVIVSKLIAKRSTQRNKLKRITKSLIIRNRSKLPKSIKCLVFPKPVILNIKNQDLEVEFLKLFEQI
jgi:ribonuclease P protein component